MFASNSYSLLDRRGNEWLVFVWFNRNKDTTNLTHIYRFSDLSTISQGNEIIFFRLKCIN